MVFAKPKSLQPVDGSGVVLNIDWYREADGEHPDLNDQVILPVNAIEQVSAEVIEDAIARRHPTVEAMLAPAPAPGDAVKQLLGQVVDADLVVSAVAERKRAGKGDPTVEGART